MIFQHRESIGRGEGKEHHNSSFLSWPFYWRKTWEFAAQLSLPSSSHMALLEGWKSIIHVKAVTELIFQGFYINTALK